MDITMIVNTLSDGKIFVYDVENVVKVRTVKKGMMLFKMWNNR